MSDDTDIQKPPDEIFKEEVEHELEKVVEAIDYDLWPIDLQVELVQEGFEVTLTNNPGLPEEVEVTSKYPSQASPSDVARQMCSALLEKAGIAHS